MNNTPKMIWSSQESVESEEIPQKLHNVLKTALGLHSACGAADDYIRTEALHYLKKARSECERGLHGDFDGEVIADVACALVF